MCDKTKTWTKSADVSLARRHRSHPSLLSAEFRWRLARSASQILGPIPTGVENYQLTALSPLAKLDRSCHLTILGQPKQRGGEQTAVRRQDQPGKSLKRVPPREAVSLSPAPRPGVHGVLTAYGDEPWTCSKEYWRLYFGMECAELLSFNIRGLQEIPKHHRSYGAAGTASPRQSPPPPPQNWVPAPALEANM